MKYMLLIYGDQAARAGMTEQDQQQEMQEYFAYNQELRTRGAMVSGESLMPVTAATTVRVRDSKMLTTDGPFAETKEQLGGYYVITAKDLDEAIELAAKIPGAKHGSIEVRPIWEFNAG
jgi:hypothetical protein